MASWEDLFVSLESYVDGLDDNQIQAQIGAFAYQGFDPKTIVRELNRKQTDRTKISEEVYFMILIFLSRGNKLDKIIKKSASEVASRFRTLMTTYGIKNSKPTSNTDVTLARITATFPMIAYKIVTRTKLARPCDQWFNVNGIVSPNAHFKTPGCFSLLPHQLPRTAANLNIIKTIIIFGHAESEIINQGNDVYRRQDTTMKLSQLIQYGRAAFHNTQVSATQRAAVYNEMKKINLTEYVALFTREFGSSNDDILKSEFCTNTE